MKDHLYHTVNSKEDVHLLKAQKNKGTALLEQTRGSSSLAYSFT